MVPRIIFCLLVTAATFPAGANITWKPAKGEYENEGIKFPQVIFHDGDRQLSYTPPQDWIVTGDAGHASFTPAHERQAEAVFSSSPAGKRTAFDKGAVEEFSQSVLEHLPEGATEGKIEAATVNGTNFHGKQNLEITVSYAAFGQRWTRSILLCLRGEEMIRIELTARAPSFAALHEALAASLFSLQGL